MASILSRYLPALLLVLAQHTTRSLASSSRGPAPSITTSVHEHQMLVRRYENSTAHPELNQSQGAGSSATAYMLPGSATSGVTLSFETSLSTEPIENVHFTSAPAGAGHQSAEQCWSDIMTWRNSSAAWYNANIANRTWPVGSMAYPYSQTWFSSTTIYPANVSTYTLCDGSPRVDVRPKTLHFSGTSTVWGTHPAAITPTFRPQPCMPDSQMCRIWYYGSDIKAKDEKELLRQCGKPAHAGAPCLIAGGPVQLFYSPVTTAAPQDLCDADNRTTVSTAPGGTAGSEVITTLGHTFSAASAYISFKTLYASYDGFWDRLGPTFSDFIFPLASTEISTHCGGYANAFNHGTQLNYADLNWPVPASAYSCQLRCSATWASVCDTCENYKTSDAAHCGTIWSDVDPVLAVPTRVRELAPEWKSCEFWDHDIANMWLDPPVPLVPREQPATPTAPNVVQSTVAASPSEGVGVPHPEQTGRSSAVATIERSATRTRDPAQPTAPVTTHDPAATNANPDDLGSEQGAYTQDPASSNVEDSTTAVDAPEETAANGQSAVIDLTLSFDSPPPSSTIHDPQIPADAEQGSPPVQQSALDSQPDSPSSQEQEPASQPGPEQTPDPPSQDPHSEYPRPDNPTPQLTLPALSILESALSPLASELSSPVQSSISDVPSMMTSIDPTAQQQPPFAATGEAPHASDNDDNDGLSLPTSTPLLITIGTLITATFAQPTDGGGVVFDSAHLSAGEQTTVSDVPIAVYASAILVGDTFLPLPWTAEAEASSTAAALGESDDHDGLDGLGSEIATLAFGSLTLTAAPAEGTISSPRAHAPAISVGGTTLSQGGSAAEIADGTTVSYWSDGLMVYNSYTTGVMSNVGADATGSRVELPGLTMASSSTSGPELEGGGSTESVTLPPITTGTGADGGAGRSGAAPSRLRHGVVWRLLGLSGMIAWLAR